MDTVSYIRRQAEKYGWYKYFSVARPIDIGTCPTSGIMDSINYGERTEVKNGLMAWGEIYYNRPLTAQEMREYELVRAQERSIE